MAGASRMPGWANSSSAQGLNGHGAMSPETRTMIVRAAYPSWAIRSGEHEAAAVGPTRRTGSGAARPVDLQQRNFLQTGRHSRSVPSAEIDARSSTGFWRQRALQSNQTAI